MSSDFREGGGYALIVKVLNTLKIYQTLMSDLMEHRSTRKSRFFGDRFRDQGSFL